MDDFAQISSGGSRLQEWMRLMRSNPQVDSTQVNPNEQKTISNQPAVQPAAQQAPQRNETPTPVQTPKRDTVFLSETALNMAEEKSSRAASASQETKPGEGEKITSAEMARQQAEDVKKAMLSQVDRAAEAQANLSPSTLMRLMFFK